MLYQFSFDPNKFRIEKNFRAERKTVIMGLLSCRKNFGGKNSIAEEKFSASIMRFGCRFTKFRTQGMHEPAHLFAHRYCRLQATDNR